MGMARRIAIMDIGSNSSRLDLFDVGEDLTYGHVDFARVPTKLASFVDEGDSLTAEGVAAACESLEKLENNAASLGPVDEWHVFATASLRGRANEDAVVSAIEKRCGFAVEVIAGEQEAAFGFASLQRHFEPVCAVMADVGGGSTEVVVADGGEIISLESLPLGSRALSKRFVAGEWPAKSEVRAMRTAIDQVLSRYSGMRLSARPVLFGIGGTARALQGLVGEGRPEFDDGLRDRVEQLCPERLDTMAAGTLIFACLWDAFSPQRFVASDANPREGYLIKRMLGL